jgi:integrase
MPKDAEEAIVREPLLVSSINVWLKDAATPRLMRKPHKAWLPFVGLLTGMRLAELVYLQKSDIVDIEGNVVFDLRRPLTIGGVEIDRPLKTKTSKRIVALHPLLHDCGFVEYAKRVPIANGFVFGHFHEADDPSDAAGKQMSNWMKALGIHVTQRQVFHSLRHSAKDWLRRNAGERLADKQCGHALNGVSANYGAKQLEPEEVRQIMGISPPTGVDFTAFARNR